MPVSFGVNPRETPWALVILVARRIMTIYLWHLTVVIVVAGLSIALGGVGLKVEPGSGTWWLYRPVWIAVLLAGLMPLIALFGRFESSSRAHGTEGAGMLPASIGALTACMGLTALALTGISLDRLPGFNWVACALIIGGVALVVRGKRASAG